MAAVTLLALTNPEADMLLAVRLVKLPIGLVIEVTALIVLALTNPEADTLLDVMLVNLPLLPLTNPVAIIFPLTCNLSVGVTEFCRKTSTIPKPKLV